MTTTTARIRIAAVAAVAALSAIAGTACTATPPATPWPTCTVDGRTEFVGGNDCTNPDAPGPVVCTETPSTDPRIGTALACTR